MAATRLIALHVNKGKTVEQCLADRTDYAKNELKTENGELLRFITSSKFPKHFYFCRNMTAGIMRNLQKERVELQTDLQIFLLR